MAIDPRSILAAVPKPGGREAILLRRVEHGPEVKMEVTLAKVLPAGRGYRALREIGIGPAIVGAFADAVARASGSLRSGKP